MAPKYKIDSTQRVIAGMMVSEHLSQPEKQAYLFGMRSMARILAGEEAGITRYIEAVVQKGV